ncbi:diacylglycerol/lipid kinase family protein [Hyphomicrobium sp.]|uniref:diacylglycerol/lipid kinase family protein n=1 Tax=Hyphomicrobium sp. TaxID=82 RepID=UPI002E359F91|nr:diacylglycerol kinase family protein [Hyphomicrobium sp.]HEX2841843.1 diacylglycerol kinase family protein [Hyphomicrobium sp.]
MRRRFLIVHNAYAGTRSRSLLRDVCSTLENAGAEVHTEHVADIEQDRLVAEQAAKAGSYDAVVAAGGDSTIRGVASGLIGTAMPLGIIPVGTGNVLAHELGLRRDPAALAQVLLHGPTHSIPCGLADQTPFLLMAGVGFDAHVVEKLSTPWKRSIGKLAYAWPILRELLRKPQTFDVHVDGRLFPVTWLVATRAAHYGGSFVIAKDQTLSGNGFHAVLVNTDSRTALVRVLIAIALGRHQTLQEVTILPCTHLRIEPGVIAAAQIDGERIENLPREILLSDKKLNLIVPS